MDIPKVLGYKEITVSRHKKSRNILPVDDISNACASDNNIKGTIALPHSYGSYSLVQILNYILEL